MREQTVGGFFHKLVGLYGGPLLEYRSVLFIGIQLGLVAAANLTAFALRFGSDMSPLNGRLLLQGLTFIVAFSLSSVFFGIHHIFWRDVGLHDLRRIVWASVAGSALSFAVLHGLLRSVAYPRSVIILTGLLNGLYLAAIRLALRRFREWMQVRTTTTARREASTMEQSQAFVLTNGVSSINDILSSNSGRLKLDIGCGYYKAKGYIGIDNLVGKDAQVENQDNLPDILMDLNQARIPFPDESCAEIRSSHFLEHSNLSWIIDESYRLLKPEGKFDFTVPYANSAEGMYPGHAIFLTERWFFENRNFQSKFEILRIHYDRSLYWKTSLLRYVIPFDVARKFLFNACWQMSMHCKKKANS